MSLISTQHTFVAHTPKTEAFTGQRLVRLIAKKDQKGNYNSHLTETLAVSIPPTQESEVSANLANLMPHILGLIDSTRDSIIRDYRLESGNATVDDSVFCMSEVLAYLEADAKGTRVTKEYLEKWFADTYSELAAEFICSLSNWDDKNLSEDQLKVIGQKINVLSGMFSGWSSGKYSPEIPKCKAMVKFAEFVAPIADDRMVGYGKKAKEVWDKKAAELTADALGF